MGDSTFLIVVILLVAGGAFYIYSNSHPAAQEGVIGVIYYDQNNHVINPNTFSVVNGVTNVVSVAFNINARNTGTAALTCNLGSISPTAFNSAISKTTKNIGVGQTGTWTSALIPVAQFEGMSPTFSAQVNCSFALGTATVNLPVLTGSKVMSVSADTALPTGNFTVDLDDTSTPAVCGDAVCNGIETTASCPSDCTLGGITCTSWTYSAWSTCSSGTQTRTVLTSTPSGCTGNPVLSQPCSVSGVSFRTTNLDYYDAGSASIAYSNTCGSALGKYSAYLNTYNSVSCANTCNTVGCASATKLFSLPGTVVGVNPLAGCGTLSSLSTIDLYSCTAANILCVCQKVSSSGCGSNTYVAKSFNTQSSGNAISLLSNSVDSAKEVACS